MEPSINETPESVQPRNATIGHFATCDAGKVAEELASHGIAVDRLNIWVGAEGLEAYEARASVFKKVFDESEDLIKPALKSGKTVVSVEDVDEAESEIITKVLSSAGADEVHHFGPWTFA